jgi:hypothetical protein
MTKNILIVALALVSILSLSFGYVQKQKASEYLLLAQQNENIAREQAAMAQQQFMRAEQQARMAEAMMVESQKRLIEAQARKK